MPRRSLDISPPIQYSPNPSHAAPSTSAGSPSMDDHADGLIPPRPHALAHAGVPRSDSARSGMSASSGAREMAGLGYAGVSTFLPELLCSLGQYGV